MQGMGAKLGKGFHIGDLKFQRGNCGDTLSPPRDGRTPGERRVGSRQRPMRDYGKGGGVKSLTLALVERRLEAINIKWTLYLGDIK